MKFSAISSLQNDKTLYLQSNKMCRSVALISGEVEPFFLLTAAVRTCEVSESPDFHGLDGSCLLEVF